MRSCVRMRSESTRAFGQPRLTNPTFGVAGVDMRRTSGFEGWALEAPLIKKCAILAVDCRIDQHLRGYEKTLACRRSSRRPNYLGQSVTRRAQAVHRGSSVAHKTGGLSLRSEAPSERIAARTARRSAPNARA